MSSSFARLHRLAAIHWRPSIRLSTLRRWLAVFLLLSVLTAGCGERPTPTPLPPLPPTATTAIEPVVSAEVEPVAGEQLVLWMPAFSGIASQGSAGTILTNAFHQFEQRNPNVKLDIQAKADAGTASLFNFLRSAQEVAPTILPDVVLINTQQLWQIVDLGMVVALSDEEIPVKKQFFPVAQSAVLYHGQMIGIPYIVDVIHLAYDSDSTITPPSNWDELLASEHPLLFPAAEAGTPNATLLQYVGAGGELLDNGTVSDPKVLEEFFRLIDQARQGGMIPTDVLDMPSFNAVWRTFSENRADVAAVEVAQFYPNATGIKPPNYAVMPTLQGGQITVAETWAFAILTEDAQRRQLALALINELLAPDVQGAWSQFAGRLPSQPAALAQWTQANAYRDFLQALLAVAVTPPNGPAFADFARRLQAAQAGILRGDLTVGGAVASMVVVE